MNQSATNTSIMCASAKVYKSSETIKMNPPADINTSPVEQANPVKSAKKRKFVIHLPTPMVELSSGELSLAEQPSADDPQLDHTTIDELAGSTVNNIKDTLIDMIQQETLKTLHQPHKSLVDETHILSHLGDYIEEPYHLIESYFQGQHLERLVRHQIESYNHFINNQIQRTIQMFNPVRIRSENDFVPLLNQYFLEVVISFENFKLYSPQIHENNGATKLMFPQEAKHRNFTYASTMTVDIKIEYIVRNTENMDSPKTITKLLPKINIGKMPIMLKSNICVLSQNRHINPVLTGECSMDCGGYFIIKGSEKTVLGQERAAENRVYCFDGKNTTKWNWFAEIKSVPDFKCISPKQIEMMIASKNNGFGHGLYITIPRIKNPIELFVLFRALGVNTDKAICEYILLDIADEKYNELTSCIQASIIDANKYLNAEDSLRHITTSVAYTPINMDKETGARKKYEFAQEVLNTDLFPHCKTLPQKLYMLGYMANKLLQTSLGWLPPDDRDSYVNKRIELTGTLLNNLFRNYFNKLVKEMQKQIVREINSGSWRSTEDYENIVNMTNIYKIMKSTTIENGINRALSTGDFSIKQANSSKVGVAQVLNRLTYVSSLSHLRRINTPLEKSGELIAPRKLHNTTFGFLCLTGDTDVLLSDCLTIKKIKDMKDGDRVNTVNIETLMDEPSDIHSFFCKMPDKLFEITTVSGRKIKATANHPFLVNNEGKCEWKNLEDLQLTDKLVVRHTVKHIPDVNTTIVKINDDENILNYYRIDLLELCFINRNIHTYKLKIIARLIGAINTDGHLHEIIDKTKKYYNASFYVGEEADVFQIVDDISALGFGNSSIQRKITKFEDKISGRTSVYRTWEVSNSGSFAYLLFLLGGFAGKKTGMSRSVPDWLINSELSIKREFLSAFQGGDGSRLSYQKNDKTWKPHVGITFQTTHNDYLKYTIKYMTQIATMFQEFEITSTINTTIVDDNKTRVCIVFGNSSENLAKYANIINYTYCEEKRRTSAPIVEHLKIKEFNKIQRESHYQYIIDNHSTVKINDLVIKTSLTVNQIRKVISKNKKGIRQTTRYTTENIYDNYLKDNMTNNGCISIPIFSIVEIEPELVYDFTTRSDNHSFVASSFVTHNCPSETPEGQSIGIVKNISYMAHLTIPTNSSSLYEYVKPSIVPVESVTAKELHGKVKVFINGAWVGITDDPMTLYHDMKDKKYRGIINIYTSIIFDFKSLEIRVCSDGGRLTRPVLRVRNNKAIITPEIIARVASKELSWNDLISGCRLDESVIEYIDPEEQNFSMIAMKAKDHYLQDPHLKINYTHCEIHPSTIFGVLASCIPYPEHNQSPRNTYQCLEHTTPVWMADGSKKPIKDVIIGDRVLTFNPKTFEITETSVIGQFVRPSDKQMWKLYIPKTHATESTEIIATEDHTFMTVKGWATVNQIICHRLYVNIYNGLTGGVEFLSVYPVLMPESLVSCIEVESDNHSFIAGSGNVGLMSSNCAMGKQAIGVYATNYDQRMDKTAYVLSYPTRPLVDTRVMNFIHLNKIPSGTQIHVAIMSHTGYNQEDSVLVNKGSIDRGLFMATIYHTEKDEDKNIIRDEIIRCKPDPAKTKGIKFGNYDKLNPQGFIPENTLVENRDVIIAKTVPIKENRNDPTKTVKYEDQSKTFRTTEETYIDKNYTGRNGDGYNFAKVRVRILRKPVLGDKFCALPTQQVLTNKGWVEIQYVDIEVHKLCTLDTDGNMCYEFPSAKFEYDHDSETDGQLYSIKNKQVEIVCTQNHRLYVQRRAGIVGGKPVERPYELIEAKDVMGKMVRFKKSMENVYPDVPTIRIGDVDYDMDAWLQLLGMFISDGSSDFHNKGIFICALKDRKTAFIDSILDKLGLIHSYHTGGNYFISGCKYPEIYENLSVLSVGALNKYLPEYVWDLSKSQSIVLLEALLQGDGHTMQYKGEDEFSRYGTISVQLADDITRLALHCGWSGTVKISEEPTGIARVGKRNLGSRAGQEVSITQRHTYYKVSIIRKQNEPWINKKKNESNEEKLIDYQGKVYCVEMPSSHTYYMRESTHSPCLIIGNSSRHGQKGTCGNIIPECDMPFTKDGLRPDIIINPHAIPSRMTIGQLKETLLGKVLLELGMFGDGTSFGNLDVKTIATELQNLGYESYGNEVLYNGLTGEQLETNIFIGPVFYQRLKHMVSDKQHSRSIGPMVNLTRQPAEGRSRDGGFRIGEMERDVMIAHGMSKFCRERLYDVSDKYSTHVCRKCGMIAAYNDGSNRRMHSKDDMTIHKCNTCDNTTDFARVEIPYAYKLLSQELQTINIVPRLITE